MRKVLASLAVLASISMYTQSQAADITLGIQKSPPFTDEEHGKAIGPLVEIVTAACAIIGQSCDIKVLPWRRVLEDVSTGKLDGMFPVYPNPEVRENYFLTQPIVRTSYVFIVNQDSPWTYKGLESLEDKTIAVYGPSSSATEAETMIKATKRSRVEIEVNRETMLLKLSRGRYGAEAVGLINGDVATKLLKRDGITNLKKAGDAMEISYRIAFSRKTMTEATARSFDAALSSMQASGTVKSILAKSQVQQAD